jgi:hypothetical protein
VFSQGFFSTAQISGAPQIELVKIFGYDTRDVTPLKTQDGLDILPDNCCGEPDGIKSPDERITIYIQNNSITPISISELLLGGAVYQYATYPKLGNFKADPIGPQQGEYVIMTGPDGTTSTPTKPNDLSKEGSPNIQSGAIVTLLLDLDSTLGNGRDMQVKLTTSNGNVFVSTLIIGQTVG